MAAAGSIGALRTGGSARSPGEPGSARCTLTCFERAFIMFALEAEVPLSEAQIGARQADPRTTTVYHHRRQSSDRSAAYVVITFVADG